MSLSLRDRARIAFAAPRYLVPPLAGIDFSTSGVKAVRLDDGENGLTLASYSQVQLPPGALSEGEIVDRAAAVQAIVLATEAAGISSANVTLPESKSYLFETLVPGSGKAEWRTAVEQRLDGLIPLPPAETDFDFVPVGRDGNGDTLVAGIGFGSRTVDETLAAFDEAGITVRALEGEIFASSRAILPHGDESTVLVVDIGKTTTKISIVARGIPRFTTTVPVGGHPLTLMVQKYFGVTEPEAIKLKAERGIVPDPEHEDYVQAMLSTVAQIRDEVERRLAYWQERALLGSSHEPITRAILIGGNASLRGLPEYLEGVLKIPVASGDVFTNLASRDVWIPALSYNESLAYSTAIGLALRDCSPHHA